MALGLLVFTGSWYVYSRLPLVAPLLLSQIAALFPDLPQTAAGIVIPLAGLALFAAIVPPVVVAGVVLPAVMTVICWRSAIRR